MKILLGNSDREKGRTIMLPKVTIAILSWNRLHYFRATIESARRCIQYPNLEWIVSDNQSDEPGLAEYIRQLDWVHHKIIKRQSHAEAMNEIVEVAQGEYLIIWPDDVQFIVAGDWLCDLIEILEKNSRIGSVTLDALRSSTLRTILKPPSLRDVERIARELYWYRKDYRFPSDCFSSQGFKVRTCGWRHSGICPSGIPSLTKTDIWRRIGPWQKEKNQHCKLIDSSAGAEDNMLKSFFLSQLPLQAGLPWLPVAADIITDPLGCKAKVRGNYRYGVYMPPQSSNGLYYELIKQDDINLLSDRPLSFSELVKPVGFHIPKDENGDRLKFSLNTSIVFDTTRQCEVPFPLVEASDASL
ncbi:MAG: glycosyltransferase family 2 protein [Candidatus Electrothrix sp. ATG1]|nr:glycosyltransferase family 2 protein [Candidatus Electrothrix sp. ATG1]